MLGFVGFTVVDQTSVELKRLSVTSSARGIGLGRRLVQEAINVAKSRGFKNVQLSTSNGNVNAIQLYKKINFKRTHLSLLAPLTPFHRITTPFHGFYLHHYSYEIN